MPTSFRTGRKPHTRCPVDDILRLERTGIRRAEIAERLGISESSVYRIIIRERRRAAGPIHGVGVALGVAEDVAAGSMRVSTVPPNGSRPPR